MRPADAVEWFFEAGAESLDFAYTGDLGLESGATSGEQLRSPADLAAWIADRDPRLSGAEASDRDLVDALALRAALARLYPAAAASAAFAPDDVDTLNLFAALPDIPPALDGGRRQAGAGRLRPSQALATLAREAVVVLGARDEGRIRRCEADDCGLVFHDESRTNNRRWCAMARCGNRAKVRAHRARATASRRQVS
jgi:predicted RNA-binding Zn ribbon-like protein